MGKRRYWTRMLNCTGALSVVSLRRCRRVENSTISSATFLRFGITARQFNAVRIGLEGKIDSIKQRRPDLIVEIATKIKKAVKVIAKLTTKATRHDKLHQKKRRLGMLKARLSNMQADQASDQVRLCFGSKKLFHAQFELKANGYASHEEWRQD